MLDFLRQNNYFLFDLYIFFLLFSVGMSMLTVNWLIQDKICINVFNQTRTFCQSINEKDNFNNDELKIRNEILAYGAMFNNYTNLIKTIPLLIWSLFIGSFLDRFPNATKLSFIWMNFLQILDQLFFIFNSYYFELSPYYLLFINLTAFITGGMTTFLSSINRYVVVNSKSDFHSIHFTIIHVILVIAPSLGTLVTGSSLWFLDDNNLQTRNYSQNFIIIFGISLISLLMIIFIKVDHDENEMHWNKDHNSFESLINVDDNNNNNNTEDNDSNNDNDDSIIGYNSLEKDDEQELLLRKPNIENNKYRKILQTFFDFENVHQTYCCFFKKHRPNHAREQLFVLVIIIFLFLLNGTGIDSIFLQFSQQVYQLNSQQYSYISVYIKVLPTIVLIISSYLLINKLKLNDGTIFLLTMTSGFISQVLIGTFANLLIFLIAIFISSLSNLAMIVIKTKIAKLVPKNEAGKIFSMTSTFESLSPTLGALIFSTIFAASISFYPTLCFHISAFITIISLILALFQDVYFDQNQ